MRSIALFALIGLLVSPLGLWNAADCCNVPQCCKAGLCPMRHTATGKPAVRNDDLKAHCHGDGDAVNAPAPDQTAKCSMGARCGHTAQLVHLAPQMRAVMAMVARFEMPQVFRIAAIADDERGARGFVSILLQPPRMTA